MNFTRIISSTAVVVFLGLNCLAAPIQISGNVTITFHDLTDTVTISFDPNNPGFIMAANGESATVIATLLNSQQQKITNTAVLTDPISGAVSDYITVSFTPNAMGMTLFEANFHSDPLTPPIHTDSSTEENGTPQTFQSFQAGPNPGDMITIKVESDACDVGEQSVGTQQLTCQAQAMPEPPTGPTFLLAVGGLAIIRLGFPHFSRPRQRRF